MQVVVWSAIFLAAFCALSNTRRKPLLALLFIGYLAALLNGQLALIALPAIALLAAAIWLSAQAQPPLLCVGAQGLVILLALAFGAHKLPGFHNTLVSARVLLTPDAVPYSLYLNLDKPLIGFGFLLAYPWIRTVLGKPGTWAGSLAIIVATSALCLLLGLALGVVHWAPKWPPHAWLWMLNNLLLVSLTEEVFFRGYLQGGLSRLLARVDHGEWYALGAAALLFGAVHLSGGWQWALLASIAGIGNGLAYRHGGLRAAVLTHFVLNAAQFLFFTYPMLARPL